MSGSAKKSDTATVADWSFMEIEGLPELLRHKANAVAVKYGIPDYADDLLGEGQLFLAVRPAAVAADMRKKGSVFVAYRAHGAMMARAEIEAGHRGRLADVGDEALEASEEEW